MSSPARPYLSNGQILQSPPFSARARTFLDDAYAFIGLYVTTLFSLDAYAAAELSQFSSRNRSAARRGEWRTGGGSGGGGDGGGPGNGGGGKKLGRVDDIRGPECKSCQ